MPGPNPILDAARARLAEIERQATDLAEEASTLRRMIAAGEDRAAPVPSVAPAPPVYVPVPYPVPQSPVYPWWFSPDPFNPWVVGPYPYIGGGTTTETTIKIGDLSRTTTVLGYDPNTQAPCGSGSVSAYVPPPGVALCVDASGALPTIEGATLYNGLGVRLNPSLRIASSN